MKNTLLAIISLICFYTNAQDNSFDKDVKDLVKLTLNLDRLNGMRSILFSELLDSEKQGFTQSYDSIVIAYNTEFEDYYKEQYTPAEVKQLLDFHNGTVGQRLAADIGRLYQNDLPEIFTLNQRLSELHKTFRKEEQSGAYSANAISSNHSHDTEIARLMEDIGAKEFLDAVKTREIMHVEPEYETDLIKAFDMVATQYIVDLKQYFLEGYTLNEIKEMLSFYKTPVGQKVARDTGKLINVTITANDMWVDSIQQIMHDTTFGKFQRQNKKK